MQKKKKKKSTHNVYTSTNLCVLSNERGEGREKTTKKINIYESSCSGFFSHKNYIRLLMIFSSSFLLSSRCLVVVHNIFSAHLKSPMRVLRFVLGAWLEFGGDAMALEPI